MKQGSSVVIIQNSTIYGNTAVSAGPDCHGTASPSSANNIAENSACSNLTSTTPAPVGLTVNVNGTGG
ncbi:MAG: hypothetical protein R3E08_02410 [Thiotrichaceae bacterium]